MQIVLSCNFYSNFNDDARPDSSLDNTRFVQYDLLNFWSSFSCFLNLAVSNLSLLTVPNLGLGHKVTYRGTLKIPDLYVIPSLTKHECLGTAKTTLKFKFFPG